MPEILSMSMTRTHGVWCGPHAPRRFTVFRSARIARYAYRDAECPPEKLMSFMKKLEPLALLLLRCGLALVFIYHGYPKLFGSTATFVEAFRAIGLPPYVVYLTCAIELFGGVAFALGLPPPVAWSLPPLDICAA